MNTIEQASWLSMKKPGILKSIYNLRVNDSNLLDGAYLSEPGEGVLIPFYNAELRKVDLGLHGGETGVHISAFNPGIRIMGSRFLRSQISGDVLALLDGPNFRPITHVEAENEGLIEERDYPTIFTYNGDMDGPWLYGKIREQERQLESNGFSTVGRILFASVLRENVSLRPHSITLPESAYQVTKKGHGNIFLFDTSKFAR